MATSIANMFSCTEAAAFLGLSPSVVRKYCDEGRLKADRVGRNWIISRKSLEHFRDKPRPVGNPNFRRRATN